jgi:glutamine synthetase
MYADQWEDIMVILTDVVDDLEESGIEVEKFHSESGFGQYEFVLYPKPALEAIDTLYQARQIITRTARKHNVHATFHPWPLQSGRKCGAGSHAHLSLNADNKDSPSTARREPTEIFQRFWAGVLDNLQGICALGMPEAESYERVTENSWTGGVWIAWGTQNREVPIRISGSMMCEIRCLDGFANMYLAVAGVIAAGLCGLVSSSESLYKDCQYNPATLSMEERQSYGITERLPTTITAALHALAMTDDLRNRLGKEFIDHYIALKKDEQTKLDKMGRAERHRWLIDQY